MKKTTAFILAACFLSSLAGIAKAGTPDQVLSLFPSTTDTPIFLLNTFTGIMFKNYQLPTKATVNNVRALMVALDANDTENIPVLVSKLNMVVVRLGAPNSNILFFRVPNQGLEIAFFWRVGAMKVVGDSSTYSNPVDPLIIEVPHQGYDGTGPAAASFLQQTFARIVLCNAAGRESSPLHPVCEPSTTHLSDAAHSYKTLFNQTHIGLINLYPDSLVIQCHGESAKYLNVYNCFNSKFISGPLLFMQSIPDNFPESFWSNFNFATSGSIAHQINDGITDIVEANSLNGGSQCYKGSHDTGRFIFLEMGDSIRLYAHSALWQRDMSKTFNETMVKWVQGK